MSRFMRGGVAGVVAAMLLVTGACSSNDDSDKAGNDDGGTVESDSYRATITRTTDGVPHISAEDTASVSFGQGYASFQDRSCDLADQILRVTSQRAQYFGPGEADANITSDFAWKAMDVVGRAAEDWPKQKADSRDLIAGFAAGWNAALDEIGADGINGWCKGQPWVQPVTPELVYAYMRAVAVQASGGALADYSGKAQPPAAAPPTATPTSYPTADDRATQMASNGWAIGSDRSENGKGMLLANPHFPWEGALRFWEVQLTVPGELDVYGAQLSGLPGVGIGFTKHVAWTHTVSAGKRFTAYKLSLVPGKPTSYMYDGQERAMTSKDATIKVLQPDGTTTDLNRTLWSSHYGPIIAFPGVGWTDTTTVTYRDANIDNDEFLEQYTAMDQAESMEDLQAAHEKFNGVPLFNTIATDDKGNAWYADTSATPNLSPATLEAWTAAKANDPLVKAADDNGAVLLDGSTSSTEWVDAPGARDPGLVPYDKQPQVERDDYLFNANDSFWMPNGTHLLEGDYSPLHGPQGTERSSRTRENAWVLDDTTAEGPSGSDGKFTLDELTTTALLNEAGTARLYRQPVAEACAKVGGTTPEVTEACNTLAAWDGRFDLDSVGAVLWREFWASPQRLEFATKFDPAQPLATPNGLTDSNLPVVVVKLQTAIDALKGVGQPITATLRQMQHDGREPTGTERTPIHGGTGAEGTTNVVSYSARISTLEQIPKRPDRIGQNAQLTPDGYWVNYGTSFLMGVSFTDDGPAAKSILTYGETQDRTSPLFTSQMGQFSEKKWKTVAFTSSDIDDQKVGEAVEVSAKRG